MIVFGKIKTGEVRNSGQCRRNWFCLQGVVSNPFQTHDSFKDRDRHVLQLRISSSLFLDVDARESSAHESLFGPHGSCVHVTKTFWFHDKHTINWGLSSTVSYVY